MRNIFIWLDNNMLFQHCQMFDKFGKHFSINCDCILYCDILFI